MREKEEKQEGVEGSENGREVGKARVERVAGLKENAYRREKLGKEKEEKCCGKGERERDRK